MKTLKVRYSVSAETIIDVLLTFYQLVSIRANESVTKYVYRVGSLDNHLTKAGKNVDIDDNIRTLLPGPPAMYATIQDVKRELNKEHYQ